MSNFLTPGAMPRQVRNPCSGCGRLASTALINLRCSARSCRPNGGTDPASTPRSAGGSWAYGRGPCRACGRCNGADGRRRVGPDGKGPEVPIPSQVQKGGEVALNGAAGQGQERAPVS